MSKELRAIEFDHIISNDLTFNLNINDNQNMPKKRQKVKLIQFKYKNQNSEEIKNKINEEFKQALAPKINTPKNAYNSSNNSLFTKTINNEK